MRNWCIGIVLVVSGVILMAVLRALGWSHFTASGVGMAVSSLGFAIQIYTAFRMRADFERTRKDLQRKHEELVKTAETLPPEQAVKLLLDSLPKANYPNHSGIL